MKAKQREQQQQQQHQSNSVHAARVAQAEVWHILYRIYVKGLRRFYIGENFRDI